MPILERCKRLYPLIHPTNKQNLSKSLLYASGHLKRVTDADDVALVAPKLNLLLNNADKLAFEADSETPYFINRAPMGCFNFLVGQRVFTNMFEMIMLARFSNRCNAPIALSHFIMDGGLRWKVLMDGVRLPYCDADGSFKGINLVPGGSFTPSQVLLMRDPILFNLMLAAKTENRGALLRLDTVVLTGNPIG